MFDQGIDGWNVGKVKNMNGMFEGATSFVQDITRWEPGSGCTFEDMFGGDAKFADVYVCKKTFADACEACGNTCGPPSYWETEAGVCTCSSLTCTKDTLTALVSGTSCKDVTSDGVLQGGLQIISSSSLTSLDLTGVKTIDGNFIVNGQSALASFSAPNLVTVAGDIKIGGQGTGEANANLTSLSFPELTQVSSNFEVSSNTKLTSVSSSKLATIGGELKIDSCLF
jgi:hypothetical protein